MFDSDGELRFQMGYGDGGMKEKCVDGPDARRVDCLGFI